jgi:lipopolysaccharide biosynthesis glycosyltransferase
MNRNLVYQLNVPNKDAKSNRTFGYIKDMYETSQRMAQEYANRCGADYYVITDPNDWKPAIGKHVAYQKLKVYDFLEYDRIVYFDSDYIIKDSAPNIFELLGNKFSAVTDPGNADAFANRLGVSRDRYINTGFMYFTKDVLEKTRNIVLTEYIDKEWELMDQGLWSRIFCDLGIEYNNLPSAEWNPADITFGIYSDHYSGKAKNLWGTVKY